MSAVGNISVAADAALVLLRGAAQEASAAVTHAETHPRLAISKLVQAKAHAAAAAGLLGIDPVMQHTAARARTLSQGLDEAVAGLAQLDSDLSSGATGLAIRHAVSTTGLAMAYADTAVDVDVAIHTERATRVPQLAAHLRGLRTWQEAWTDPAVGAQLEDAASSFIAFSRRGGEPERDAAIATIPDARVAIAALRDSGHLSAIPTEAASLLERAEEQLSVADIMLRRSLGSRYIGGHSEVAHAGYAVDKAARTASVEQIFSTGLPEVPAELTDILRQLAH